MRTRYWLILTVGILAGLCARADTVKLKDGTTLEGEIVSEDDSTISILLEFAGGTITQTRQINKSDVAEVTHWTPEQKAQRKIERDYEDLQKYKLNPNTSYPVTYYDQVIQNAFRKFLTDHPNSPYTSNIIERAGQWIAERDQVIGGKAKYQGRWMPAADVDHVRGEQMLQQGRAALAHGSFDLAIQQLRPILSMKELPELVTQARELLTSAYQQSYTPLAHQQESLQNEIPSAQQHADQAAQSLNQATTSLRQTSSSGSSFSGPRDANGGASYQSMGGNAQQVFQNQNAVNQAQSDFSAAQGHLAELQSQLAVVKERMTALQTQAWALGIPVTGSAQPVAPAIVSTQPPTSAPASGDSAPVLTGMADWMRNNWPILAGAGLVAIYLLSRLTKG